MQTIEPPTNVLLQQWLGMTHKDCQAFFTAIQTNGYISPFEAHLHLEKTVAKDIIDDLTTCQIITYWAEEEETYKLPT